MKQIAIYGAGGFAREVAWLAETCDGGYQVVCFVDDNPVLAGKQVNDIPVMGLGEASGRFAGIGEYPNRQPSADQPGLHRWA